MGRRIDNSKYTCTACGESDYGKAPYCKCEREYYNQLKYAINNMKFEENNKSKDKKNGN